MDYLLLGLLIFLTLNLIDIVFTNAVIRCGGKEFNPIVRWVFSRFGIVGFCTFKLLIFISFAITYLVGELDMFLIWYFDFSYFIILTLMFFDLRKTQVKII